jgi:hypothetical protein
MSLYRVVVSFFTVQKLQYMAERGVLAMDPGEALNNVLISLQVDLTRINSFKSFVSKPDELSEFSEDAQFLTCINTKHSVKDIWSKRFGS